MEFSFGLLRATLRKFPSNLRQCRDSGGAKNATHGEVSTRGKL